jgi:lipoate-protein ligase A
MAKKVEKSAIWRLLITPPWDGYLNMAFDELLFEEVKEGLRPPTLRFYEWSGNWISFGYFQSPEKALNLEAAQKLGVKFVRRLTGGRAVVHSEDLTYALVARDAQKEGLGTSLKETYRQIGCALTSGFTRLGLPVGFSFGEKSPAPPPREGPIACFLTLSDYEISFGGKKLVGSAQRREGFSFLQHGSIPLSVRNRKLAERVLTRRKSEANEVAHNGAPDFSPRYATVEEVLGEKIPVDVLSGALRKGFEEVLAIEFEPEQVSARQLDEAGRLAEKYSSKEWNERKGRTVAVCGGPADFVEKKA